MNSLALRWFGLPGLDHGREQREPDPRGGAAARRAGLGAAVQPGPGEGRAGAAAGAGPEPPGACKTEFLQFFLSSLFALFFLILLIALHVLLCHANFPQCGIKKKKRAFLFLKAA